MVAVGRLTHLHAVRSGSLVVITVGLLRTVVSAIHVLLVPHVKDHLRREAGHWIESIYVHGHVAHAIALTAAHIALLITSIRTIPALTKIVETTKISSSGVSCVPAISSRVTVVVSSNA